MGSTGKSHEAVFIIKNKIKIINGIIRKPDENAFSTRPGRTLFLALFENPPMGYYRVEQQLARRLHEQARRHDIAHVRDRG